MTAVRDTTGVEADVAVVGGGLAGLATALQLGQRDHRVVCVEPRPWPRSAVGESLEFSAAALLSELGIDVTVHEAGHLYPKTSVRIVGRDQEFVVWPPAWFARPPVWCSRVAFHTDRRVLDKQLRDLAVNAGVEIVPDRVVSVERDDQRITALVTGDGARVTARWYVDASGHRGRVLGRGLGLERTTLGSSRTAYWTRYADAPESHATTLHFPDPAADELAWVWEIPLNDAETSVGAVMTTAKATTLRADGLGPREILAHQAAAIPKLRRLVDQHPNVELHATTYTPSQHRRTVGPNWILVGDAAAMVDPLTSNGVTSALRHADAAGRLVARAIERGRLARHDAWVFQHTAPANVATLERAMEAFLYDPTARQRLGLRAAVNLYAGTGVITNSLYAKTAPHSVTPAAGCTAVLAISRAWTRTARAVVALIPRRAADVTSPARSHNPAAAPRTVEHDAFVGASSEHQT